MAIKEAKTARELEAMILDRSKGLETQIHHLEVRSDPTHGWEAFVIARPEAVGDLQARTSRIAALLRDRYDLKKE